jgi:hypothetical protein
MYTDVYRSDPGSFPDDPEQKGEQARGLPLDVQLSTPLPQGAVRATVGLAGFVRLPRQAAFSALWPHRRAALP